MKKSLLVPIGLLSIVIILSNFTNNSSRSFVFMSLDEEPKLPETPFDYRSVEFPNHLVPNRDSIIEIGYGSGPIDTSTFTKLENDIVTLGRVLFFDEKLSALENISCASCHQQEKSFADELALSEGISSPTRRNSMQLNDLGWSNRSHFFWDMSQSDLHEMIVLPLTDENEIGANMNDVELKLSSTNYYPQLFKNAYGTEDIDEFRIVDALVQFISSMNTFNSKFDNAATDNFADFTEKEIVGLELFSEHCGSCHNQGAHDPFGFAIEIGGIGTTDFFTMISPLDMFPEIFNNGLEESHEDRGAGEWREDLNNLFKIPTLRNIAVTGPYMHDGRFETLEEVLDHYSEDVIENEWTGFIPAGGFNFSNFEKESLISFLHTLTDESFLKDEKWSNPFGSISSVPQDLDINIVIKPNPMMETALVEFENSNNDDIYVNILNSAGQLISSNKVQSNSYRIDKNDFSAGVYFIQVIKGELRSLQKLIVN